MKARQGPADVECVRAICLRMGVIPPEFRLDVWTVLLLGELRKEDDDLEVAIDQVDLDLPNQNVVEVDVERYAFLFLAWLVGTVWFIKSN